MDTHAPVDKLTILIVDDDEAQIRSLRRGFERLGHRVLGATEGDQAVELAREHSPDVALLDLHLGQGKENGHSICARICALQQSTVVFMWSGAPPAGICYESLRAGAVEHLVKPVVVEVLLAKFNARLQLQRESEAPPATPPPASPGPPASFPLQIDAESGAVLLEGRRLNLRRNERRLIVLLLSKMDTVLSLADIEQRLKLASERAARTLLSDTRAKLGAHRDLIETVYAEGVIVRRGPATKD